MKETFDRAAVKSTINNVFVICGSAYGNSEIIRDDGRDTGRLLGENGFRLVYGGGRDGLMGVVLGGYNSAKPAQRAMAWTVPGFAPQGEDADDHLAELMVAEDLHDRVKFMIKESDAMIELPGGTGTEDEEARAKALNDLLRHEGPHEPIYPIIIVNTDGFYNFRLLQWAKQCQMGMMNPEKMRGIFVVDTPANGVALLNELRQRPLLEAGAQFSGADKPDHWPKSFADYLPSWIKKMERVEAAIAEVGLSKPFVRTQALTPKG